jgi:N-acetylglucosaminyldiphosphoundecaprenol N-acetyl-beta-D-mannosaminyltransferase
MAGSVSGRHSVLGVEVNAIERAEAARHIIDAASSSEPLGVSALAVHGIMEAVADPALQYRLNDLELVVPDGQPVRWALRWLHGSRLSDRVCGPDLMADLCELAAERGLPIFLYGSTAETLASLVSELSRRYPTLEVAGSQPSRFRPSTAEEQAADVARIRASGARMTFVGLGCPRQEIWTYETRRELSMPVLAVGAAFDFHAGLKERAPYWMQRRGLEWLYRLMDEPARLWRRYLLLNPAYLTLVALDKLGLRRIPINRLSEEPAPVRPG